MAEYIGHGGQRGELKHLSTRRKGKKIIDFPSSGERKGKSPNLSRLREGGCGNRLGLVRRVTKVILAEVGWNDPPQKVKVL